MVPLFLGLSLLNILCLATAAALGYASADGDRAGRHILAGAVATLACCGVHCVVFTYFVATAKWARHAIAVKRLDAALAAPTRSFKAQAFPAALVAIAAALLAAFSGAATDARYLLPSPRWHHAFALGALAVNLIAAAVEYRAITRNGRLIDRILSDIAAEPPPTVP